MSDYFKLSVIFLDHLYHGRCDGGQPEWPPSPLRLFQALASGAAAVFGERMELATAIPALNWLEQQPPPTIVAPMAKAGSTGYRLYVPDNVGDLVAGSWSRGGTASIADYRTEKQVRPMFLNGDTVHFLYEISNRDEFESHREMLGTVARGITQLGWGVDMVASAGEVISAEECARLQGVQWLPDNDGPGVALRVAQTGTLRDLMRKHSEFLNRIARDGKGCESFRPVTPLSVYRTIRYRSGDLGPSFVWAAFSLLKPDASGYRPFGLERGVRNVAGMLRNAVAEAAKREGWPTERINTFVHGKQPDGSGPFAGGATPERLYYLPLPTINSTLRRVESIRRVLIAAPASFKSERDWLRRVLSGAELRHERGETAAIMTTLPGSDWVLRQYTDASTEWTTATPVILPIHDGYDQADAGRWIRIAFEQAGFTREVLEASDIQWRRVGFMAGADLVSRYQPPRDLSNKPRYHVHVRFPGAIPGPLNIGSGRFRGFGLFVNMRFNIDCH